MRNRGRGCAPPRSKFRRWRKCEILHKRAGQIMQPCYNLIIRRSTPALAF
nr:MAG TPA: hypothetical protein [Caudoviricetes sp.]